MIWHCFWLSPISNESNPREWAVISQVGVILYSVILPPFGGGVTPLWDLSSPARDWTWTWHWKGWVLTTGPGNSFPTLICNVHYSFEPLFNLTAVPHGASGKEPTCQCRKHETQVWFLSQVDTLKEGMAVYSSILAWRIPWTEEPGGPQSIGSQRVRHD